MITDSYTLKLVCDAPDCGVTATFTESTDAGDLDDAISTARTTAEDAGWTMDYGTEDQPEARCPVHSEEQIEGLDENDDDEDDDIEL